MKGEHFIKYKWQHVWWMFLWMVTQYRYLFTYSCICTMPLNENGQTIYPNCNNRSFDNSQVVYLHIVHNIHFYTKRAITDNILNLCTFQFSFHGFKILLYLWTFSGILISSIIPLQCIRYTHVNSKQVKELMISWNKVCISYIIYVYNSQIGGWVQERRNSMLTLCSYFFLVLTHRDDIFLYQLSQLLDLNTSQWLLSSWHFSEVVPATLRDI